MESSGLAITNFQGRERDVVDGR